MESFTLDSSKHGLSMIHTDYEQMALRTIWNSQKGLLTRDFWEIVNKQRNGPISRSSIINFL